MQVIFLQMWFNPSREQALETSVQTVNVTNCMDYIPVSTLKDKDRDGELRSGSRQIGDHSP